MKKNARRLENLVSWLDNASPATQAACPILVIDDEADQASVNTAKEKAERTKINNLLVQLLSLPKAAYIGYTATPFANLFVDPKFPEDVYPRDFIVDLPQPADYFGPERLFVRERLEHDDDSPDDGLDVIRRIPEEDLKVLQPPTKRADRDSFAAMITPTMKEAVRYFVLATAARRARGQQGHSTMLVHTTSLTSIHMKYEAPVKGLRDELLSSLQTHDQSVLADLRALWDRERAAVTAESLGEIPVAFEDLESHLVGVLEELDVVIDNYRSLERLHYRDEPRVVIVIGGNTLSRGLTLEGLVVSYFARATNAYDTLLQMGRWFGYRRGYQDLPRIWISEQLEEWFRHLATVEAELRIDVARYEDDHVTPINFGARIRTHPKLAITSALKMRHA
ncbi:MAG: Z1 domain-containing protein, partial [Vicinamibacterales bacterium]